MRFQTLSTNWKFFIALVVTLCLMFLLGIPKAFAHAGGDISGGGDPRAVEFLRLTSIIITFQKSGAIDLPVPHQILDDLASRISESLEGKSPLLIFIPSHIVSCFGAPKAGCVNDGVISIAAYYWDFADSRERYELVLLEILRSLGVVERYKLAAIVSQIISATERADDMVNWYKGFEWVRLDSCALNTVNKALEYGADLPGSIPQVAFDDATSNLNSFIAPLRVSNGKLNAIWKLYQVSLNYQEMIYRPSQLQNKPIGFSFSHLLTPGPRNAACERAIAPVSESAPEAFEPAGNKLPLFTPCERVSLNLSLRKSLERFAALSSSSAHDHISIDYFATATKSNAQRPTNVMIISTKVTGLELMLSATYKVESEQVGVDKCSINNWVFR